MTVELIMQSRFLCLVIGWKILCQFSTKQKPDQNQLHLVHAIFPTLWASYRQMPRSNSAWFIRLFAPPLNGHSNYFAIGFSTVTWKPLHHRDYYCYYSFKIRPPSSPFLTVSFELFLETCYSITFYLMIILHLAYNNIYLIVCVPSKQQQGKQHTSRPPNTVPFESNSHYKSDIIIEGSEGLVGQCTVIRKSGECG